MVLREAKNSVGPLSITIFLCGLGAREEVLGVEGRLGNELHGFRGFIPRVVFFGRLGEDWGEEGIGGLGLGRALVKIILAGGFRGFLRIGLGVVSCSWVCLSAGPRFSQDC